MVFTISRLKRKLIDLSIDFYVVSYQLDLLYSQFCFVICQSLIGLSVRLTPPQSVTLSQTQFNSWSLYSTSVHCTVQVYTVQYKCKLYSTCVHCTVQVYTVTPPHSTSACHTLTNTISRRVQTLRRGSVLN